MLMVAAALVILCSGIPSVVSGQSRLPLILPVNTISPCGVDGGNGSGTNVAVSNDQRPSNVDDGSRKVAAGYRAAEIWGFWLLYNAAIRPSGRCVLPLPRCLPDLRSRLTGN